MMKFYVYKITNMVNGKFYIGKTNNIDRRYKAHMQVPFSNTRGADSCVKFYHSIRKYGISNFSQPEILGTYEDEALAYQAEKDFIEKYDSRKNGLNTAEGGRGTGSGEANSFYGKTHTPETKQIMSEKKIEYLSTHPSNFQGRHHTDETKKIISETNKGNTYKLGMKLSPANIAAIVKMRAEKFDFYSELNRGSNNPQSKLTEEDIPIIYSMILEKQTDQIIADKFGVTRKIINNIRLGKLWQHIPRPIGLDNGRKKLTKKEVIEIIKLISQKIDDETIANQFDTSVRSIQRIRTGEVWKSIPR